MSIERFSLMLAALALMLAAIPLGTPAFLLTVGFALGAVCTELARRI